MAKRSEDADNSNPQASKELLAFGFGAQKWRFSRCLAPGGECHERAISSHSIQNSRVLDLLCRKGHVKMMKHEMTRDVLKVDFRDVGRNEASTFHGFCSHHDSEIFRPIDTKPISLTDDEQLFLIAYRSVAQEVHASMEAAFRSQSVYQKRVELGIDKGNEPEPAGMMAVERMMIAYETHQYKELLDDALVTGAFSTLTHTFFRVSHERPSFAVSGFFDLEQRSSEEEPPRLAINIFPSSAEETLVIFSFTHTDALRAKAHVAPLFEAAGDFQKYLVSKLVLNRCENFVVSPDVFDTWSQERVAKICNYFRETIRKDRSMDDPDLYLF